MSARMLSTSSSMTFMGRSGGPGFLAVAPEPPAGSASPAGALAPGDGLSRPALAGPRAAGAGASDFLQALATSAAVITKHRDFRTPIALTEPPAWGQFTGESTSTMGTLGVVTQRGTE
jgi:hypothetical protein